MRSIRNRKPRATFTAATAPMLLALVVGLASTVPTGPAGASGSHEPGSMTTGTALVAGATNNAVSFVYVAPTANPVTGQILLVVPSGWSQPQKRKPTGKGALSISGSTCTTASLGTITGTGPWTVAINVVCPPATGFTLDYGLVTAPTTAAVTTFAATHVALGASIPLTTQPTLTVGPGPAFSLSVTGSTDVIDPRFPTVTTADFSNANPRFAQYAVLAFDRYDNLVGDVSGLIRMRGANCLANICIGRAPGEYTVVTAYGAARGGTQLEVAPYSALGMTCRGQNYDTDATVSDGCEVAATAIGTTQATAPQIATLPCNDSSTFDYGTNLPSDQRIHTDPAVAGFDASSGSTPVWSKISAPGSGLCFDDYSVTLNVTGSAVPGCYSLTVVTDKGQQSGTADASGTVTLSQGVGAYGPGSTVSLEVKKNCSSSVTENVTVDVSGHL